MTGKIDNALIIETEQPQQCDMCGKIAELRPYGPNGVCVCFQCMKKDEKAAIRQFEKRFGLRNMTNPNL